MQRRVLIAMAAVLLVTLGGVVFLRQRTSQTKAEAPPLRSYATTLPHEKEGPSTYPSDWAWIRRNAPYWNSDPVAFQEEVGRARSMRKAAALRGDSQLLSPIVPAGPDNIGGRFCDIEWDPSNPSIVYAGAA